MIEAIQDIDGIIKAICMARLMNDGHIDGRVARGIANEIIKQAGQRFVETKEQLSRKEKELVEKDEQLSKIDKALQEKDARIKALEKELARYKKFFGDTARPIANMTNSSVPSSHNPLSAPRTQSLRKKSDKKPGGQKGHEGHTREWSENPDTVEACPIPQRCPVCGELIDPNSLKVLERRQVIDIPLPVLFLIKEYVQHQATCKCGHIVKGIFPDHVTGTVCFGENIQALVAYLSTLQAIPMKRLAGFMENICGISISQGSVSNILNYMRKKAKKPYEEIRKVIEHSEVAGADETGVDVGGKNEWMWTFQTNVVTFLAVYEHHGKDEIDDMFPGGLPNTILETDRLSAYFSMSVKNHQICLAHLLRNTTYFAELLPDYDWPKRMLELLRESIHLRKTQNTNSEDEENFKKRFDEMLQEEVTIDDEECQKLFDTFRRGLAKHTDHIFLFLSNHKVHYDNNASERALRPAKTKMKVSGQFRSHEGANNYATLMTIAKTAEKNGQNPFFALQRLAEFHEE